MLTCTFLYPIYVLSQVIKFLEKGETRRAIVISPSQDPLASIPGSKSAKELASVGSDYLSMLGSLNVPGGGSRYVSDSENVRPVIKAGQEAGARVEYEADTEDVNRPLLSHKRHLTHS